MREIGSIVDALEKAYRMVFQMTRTDAHVNEPVPHSSRNAATSRRHVRRVTRVTS